MQIKNIIFAGTPLISAEVLTELLKSGIPISACYTQPDRPKGRGQKLGFSPVKQVGLNYAIPIFQPSTLKDPQEQEFLKKLNPDLIIVFAYGLILPKIILEIPRFGCINIHTSLLPRWRGAAPTQHAILAGDDITGISIIQMETGLDTGPVLYSLPCPISHKDTNQSLLIKLKPLAINAILTVLQQIETNNLQPKIQEQALACYAKKIDKHDALINWLLPATKIDRLIRAFIPEPICFTNLRSQDTIIQNIKIWKAIVKKNPYNGDQKIKPGSIIKINNNNIEVATGIGILQVEQLQFPGGKTQDINTLLNAKKYKDLFENNCVFY